MVLLVIRYRPSEHGRPGRLRHTKSLLFDLRHFDRLVEASLTGTVIRFAKICGRLLHSGVLCMEYAFCFVV